MMQITYNDKKSFDDFKLVLNYFKPQPPTPNVIKIEVPFMNGSYDFSTIGSFGEITYQDRKISTSFQFVSKNKAEMLTRYSQILQWLMTPGKQKLIYSNDLGRYYMAKVDETPSWDSLVRTGTLKVDFVADPFKYKLSQEGEDIWDDFNFLTDKAQYTNEFTVAGTTAVTMYNGGMNVTPIINSTTNMTLIFEGKTYSLVPGDNTLYGLRLKNGENTLSVNGTGTIIIKFREQFL